MSDRTIGYDFFERPEIAALRISDAEAENLGGQHFGHPVIAESLGSQQDQNFMLTTVDGRRVGVLKIANPVFSEAEVKAQDQAAQLVQAAEPRLRLATAVPGVDGRTHRTFRHADGTSLIARVLRYLPGTTVEADTYLGADVARQMGDVCGRVSRALRSFDHPGLDRTLAWDPQHVPAVTEKLISYQDDEGRRDQLLHVVAQAWKILGRLAGELPRQAVHLDLTNSNLIAEPDDARRYDGILDFGDLCRTWAVAELACTATSVLHHPGADALSALPTVTGFDAVRPLSAAEAQAVWPLVVIRAAILVLNGTMQVSIEPDNEYAVTGLLDEWRMFDAAVAVPMEVMSTLICDALSLPRPGEVTLPDDYVSLVAGQPAVLDLSTTAPVWDRGAWLHADAVDRALGAARATGARVAMSAYAQPRLDQAAPLRDTEPATLPTFCDAWFFEATALRAPWAGVTRRTDQGFTLSAADVDVVLDVTLDVDADALPGMHLGEVAAGAPLTTVGADHRIRVQVRRADGPPVPAFVAPRYGPGWLALTADPAALLGAPDGDTPESSAALLERRSRYLADVQEHYYVTPPRFERGWRHHLLSTDGRSYLDMVNNVALLGHSHPRLSDAVARQYELLNTNSRFNYSAIAEFTAKIAARLPPSLDQIFLVNSGSEASDLAMRLALGTTGRQHLVSMGEAYHGWTYLTDAVSTSTADNPNALTTRPRWVHTVESANSYRGRYRGAQAHQYARDAVADIGRLAADGVDLAGFIAEPVYGNAGGMALPDGYLKQVYAAIRDVGGLAIADEVQVGYGRLGQWFWGFEQQGVVPDVVSVAKAVGNGYPLGIVATTKVIAEAYRSQGYFFSSAGGSPASCVVGSTVLDVLEDEDLQGNARRVGGHLRGRLLELAERHSIIGTVHGHGLYLGVELVRDRDTLEPATEETLAICERMLDKGVVIQPTGDRMCVLKVKPPLCLDQTGADYFVDALDSVLTEGW
ncbi:aminotransferase [Mycolicibacterium sp. 050158]|uniref:aminotransferase n=1 Tax=Mycolicibacterium sp. 050158 TaxID=3090602 RepID=UPI00299E6526|nr:aminotransferase [Mycolicibacterium sp. 050158]MDX1888010.1 aminotransferase [Mycolicibacterium sp. 050158]